MGNPRKMDNFQVLRKKMNSMILAGWQNLLMVYKKIQVEAQAKIVRK